MRTIDIEKLWMQGAMQANRLSMKAGQCSTVHGENSLKRSNRFKWRSLQRGQQIVDENWTGSYMGTHGPKKSTRPKNLFLGETQFEKTPHWSISPKNSDAFTVKTLQQHWKRPNIWKLYSFTVKAHDPPLKLLFCKWPPPCWRKVHPLIRIFKTDPNPCENQLPTYGKSNIMHGRNWLKTPNLFNCMCTCVAGLL